ncbi:RNA-directed DNA polymerase from mobile element jockey-like [Brachionus plicatilis]|uniref:RNA-directed DNA polymerase from mobile element jockey-like n=1 Tax=Brachionus plicatilis TaxID=10195 RepID=A0A3M7SBW8_BRAPC|nr:RNA-directed DNA polymerase from mobile element jockey-like [Brachionus plicatilis]
MIYFNLKQFYNGFYATKSLSQSRNEFLLYPCSSCHIQYWTCSATNENIVGVNITIGKNEKLAIFTIYSSPSTVLNDETLHFINSHFPKFIIVGDLNSKSKTWHLIKENTNGEILENFINASNCHLLNCEKPTFPRGNSIIDLTICSLNMYDFADKISDHQPTITSFKNLIPRKKLFTINKIDWAKSDQILKV